MGNNIRIKKTVYNKDVYDKVVDRNFNAFKRNEEEPVEKTIEQFFKDYEDLYLEIPVEGESSSHRYLYEKSGELLSIANDYLDIQPLLDEIGELRVDYLKAQEEIIELRIENATLSGKVE
jgi:NurA-like 5'-3' nuclease